MRIIEALRAGVADVLPKTSDYLDHLPEAVARVLETQRAARRQADSVTRLKDEFLATLSHELRTPLNAIVGWTQYLLNDHSDADRLVKGLQVIERNARLQAQMVEDLLDMSRMLAGKLRLETRPMDLASVAEEAIAAVRPAAEARQIELHPALGQGGVILGDPARLQQVVWNLLMNAIKFTPRQGRVSLSLRQHDDTVALEVSDNGRGIKGEFLGSVFDRFTQEDVSTGSTGSTASGLGLGLAIARHLVELHGGQIRAASAGPGMGAAFTVTLPLAAAGSGASASETPPA
ncbi:two component sensor histidine kinase protein [Herbaspirillum seropedicae SmR1]|uniref:histidine kinase n=1 Tax=Herbaspirillum seropedicae (strain SmR1) TaxID=757424 RepID=D8IWH2_HERSS|nr:two component sensor histidine kinase protein [Herbaspirillum seropedicae SmR1]